MGTKWFAVLGWLAAAGCVPHVTASRIAEIEVPAATSPQDPFDTTRMLVRRMVDARPPEYSRALGGGGIVLGGSRSEYTTTLLAEGRGGDSTIHQGWLPMDLPYLLARALGGAEVRVADELTDAGAGGSWDYLVEGRLLRTRETNHYSVVLTYLGVLGVPMQFARYELTYELSLYDATAPDQPLMIRSYEFDERVAVGWYYNHKRARGLPLRALRTTVARSAKDLVLAVAKHRGRVRIASPAAPPSSTPG